MLGNIFDGMGSTGQILPRGVESGVDDILVGRVAGFLFEQGAETGNAQISLMGQMFQGQVFRIVQINITHNLVHRAGIGTPAFHQKKPQNFI